MRSAPSRRITAPLISAVRGVWSPCGLSMLSSITPMTEAGRGHRFASTATWFTVGGVVGGLTPPPAETGDGIESINTDRRVAAHLGAALDDLVADTALVEAVGADLVANFVDVKRHEWNAYLDATGLPWDITSGELTQWERDWYLTFH